MTRKQMKKIAQEIYKCDQIHADANSSMEEKSRAECRIMQLSKQIMALKDGINVMLEIDTIIQQLAEKEKN